MTVLTQELVDLACLVTATFCMLSQRNMVVVYPGLIWQLEEFAGLIHPLTH